MSNKVFVTHEFNCQPETLFQWLTQADKVVQWFWPNEFKALSAQSEAYSGGSYKVQLQKDNGDIFWLEGKYTEVLPFSKIEYEYQYVGLPGTPNSSVVRMHISPTGTSQCILKLSQEFDLEVQVSPSRGKAWEAMLLRLARLTL